jgi:coenzyme F420 hydrogenase subunit beta
MDKYPKVIELIVENDLCTGCGMCTYKCQSNALTMDWNENGFLVPVQAGNCNLDSACLSVCPFNPYPEEITKTENEIADIFLTDSTKIDPKIGKYVGIYAGYSDKFRLASSSGGVGTFVMTELLERGVVDHVFSVKEGDVDSDDYYKYSISSNKIELLNCSQTKYFPVSLSNVFSEIDKIEGRVAIVGVACFVKAIRLAQVSDATLKEKIPFLVGIICGGIKSRFFTEYLADSAGIKVDNISNPNYRVKDLNSTAGDYSFECTSKAGSKTGSIKMKSVGDMWGTGIFKANACDYCDDVTTELADISLGDAWLSPYMLDGKGTNVIVTRSKIADMIIKEGFESENLVLESLSLDSFIYSQQGSFNHRQLGLPFRIKKAIKNNRLVPPKRVDTSSSMSIDLKIVQYYRMKVRAKSFMVWTNSKNSNQFNTEMSSVLNILKKFTKLNHYKRTILSKQLLSAIIRKFKKIL